MPEAFKLRHDGTLIKSNLAITSAYRAAIASKLSPVINFRRRTLIMVIRMIIVITLITLIRIIRLLSQHI